MIYTSFYSNKEVDESKYRYVSISVGTPRWSLPYTLHHCKILKPYGVFGVISDEQENQLAYKRKLDKIGVEAIRKELIEVQGDAENIVLLCYEKDVRECHRGAFAEWWFDNTGEEIKEIEVQPKKPLDLQLKMF